MSSVCRKLYEEIVTRRESPPKKLLSLLPLFEALSKTGPVLTSFDLPEEHLAVLHICLSCIKGTYQKENQDSDLLLGLAKVISEIVPQIDEHSLRSNLNTSKIWSSFVKQVCVKSYAVRDLLVFVCLNVRLVLKWQSSKVSIHLKLTYQEFSLFFPLLQEN